MNSIDLDNYPAVVEAVRARLGSASGHRQTVGLRWVRNCTLEAIEPYLRYFLLQEGIGCEIAYGGYDTMRQDLVNISTAPLGVTHTATVLALFGAPGFVRDVDLNRSPERVVDYLRGILTEVQSRCSHLVIVNTWIPPLHIVKSPGGSGLEKSVQAANAFIRHFVASHPGQFALADWERLAVVAGEVGTFDYRFYYSAKAPFKHHFLKLLAFEIVRSLRVMCGRAKKCLVLDCDDTLWKGILGEDGPSALQIDPYDSPGSFYYRFQETVLALQEQGVLLCLCSKNEERDVFDFMDNNPHCLIKKRHLAAWRVNWKNKAENLQDLAGELNLGLDSFVFVDDSAAECALVQESLPAVTVLQVPSRLHEFPDLLLRGGLFDVLSATAEDRERTQSYRVEAKRKEARHEFVDIDQYLAHLELRAEVREATADELARVTQLTQKTNQFNLTTIRYSQAEIENLARSPDAAVFRLRPADRFGDYGISGVLIARREGATGVVDTLLMSCRILERRLELAFVAEVLKTLETRWQLGRWRAGFRPTEKNSITSTFWDRLGFTPTEQTDGRKSYIASPGTWQVPLSIDFIKVN